MQMISKRNDLADILYLCLKTLNQSEADLTWYRTNNSSIAHDDRKKGHAESKDKHTHHLRSTQNILHIRNSLWILKGTRGLQPKIS